MAAEPIRPLIPLPEDRAALLTSLVDGLDQASLHWLSGYVAGLAAQPFQPLRETVAAAAAEPRQRLTILYGSQTGNAKRLAEALARDAETAGLGVRLVRADAYPLRELKDERLLYVVISTQGDGDPPDDARAFVEFLDGKRAPQLPQMSYAVLGLGDSSYAQFCAVGNALDARLSALGATRLFARGEADVDVDPVAGPWLQQALSSARETLKSSTPRGTVTPLRPAVRAATYGRDRPYAAELLANQRISARGAAKDIRHIELSLDDSGLGYEPGDSLGIWPQNDPGLVDAILEAARLAADTQVTHDGQTLPLRDWLLDKRELTRLARPFVFAHAQRAKADDLDAIVASPVAFPQLLGEHQVIDLLARFPASWSAPELVAALRPLAPRLYSIASSRKVVENEAHLTVARIAYEAFGRDHIGAASNYLAVRDDDGRIPVYVEANERFRLPADPARDIIMIGPGTGVAPFRGFLQDRTAVGASGRNWLFFGNPHFHSDFLYQVEWQQALKRGELHRLDVAFSRDRPEKVYVQHALRRRGAEIHAWLRDGAHLYVCGDATHMAKDVHATLRDIAVEHGGRSVEDAEAWLAELAAERRYARDVY